MPDITLTPAVVEITAPLLPIIPTILTLTPAEVEIAAPLLPIVPTILTLSPVANEVTAPLLSVDLGTRAVLPTAASFAVVAPVIRVLTAPRGHTLSALDLPGRDQATTIRLPNLVTQTSYEVTIVGTDGLADVTMPALVADLVKLRYETTRPLFGYSPSGTLPAPHDTGVYLSSDLGVSWHYLALPEFGPSNLSHPVIAHGLLWFGDSYGQLACYDLQTRRTQLTTWTGPPADVASPRTPLGLAAAPGASTLLLYASGPVGGIWRSTDNGATFVQSNRGQTAGIAGCAVAFHPVEAGLCYAGGDKTMTMNAPLYRSTDAGVTWTLASTLSGTYGSIVTIALGADPDIVYLRTTTALLKSTDQGATFAVIQTGLPSLEPAPTGESLAQPGGALVVSPSDESILYTVVGVSGTSPVESRVYRSTNAGASWSQVYALVPTSLGPLIMALAVHPTDADLSAFVTFGRGTASGSGLFRTTNGGTSWTRAAEAHGIVDAASLFGIAYGLNGATMWMAAVGRHTGPKGTVPTKVKIGDETIYGEQHEATVTLPFAPAFVTALTDRTQIPALPLLPKLPLLRLDIVHHYRTGALEKSRLAEVRLERLTVREGSGDRQLSLFGRTTHEEIARGAQPARAIPRSEIESIDDTTAELTVTLPGIHTAWQTYDTIVVNGRVGKLSAIRYSITTARRLTILSTAATSTRALDPDAATATDHPQLIVGRTPTSTRRGTPARKTLIWRRA